MDDEHTRTLTTLGGTLVVIIGGSATSTWSSSPSLFRHFQQTSTAVLYRPPPPLREYLEKNFCFFLSHGRTLIDSFSLFFFQHLTRSKQQTNKWWRWRRRKCTADTSTSPVYDSTTPSTIYHHFLLHLSLFLVSGSRTRSLSFSFADSTLHLLTHTHTHSVRLHIF